MRVPRLPRNDVREDGASGAKPRLLIDRRALGKVQGYDVEVRREQRGRLGAFARARH